MCNRAQRDEKFIAVVGLLSVYLAVTAICVLTIFEHAM